MIGDGVEGRVNGMAAVNLQWGRRKMGAWGVTVWGGGAAVTEKQNGGGRG